MKQLYFAVLGSYGHANKKKTIGVPRNLIT